MVVGGGEARLGLDIYNNHLSSFNFLTYQVEVRSRKKTLIFERDATRPPQAEVLA